MKKIGIIDYFLDNYHSANYPGWLHTYSGGELAITCAYAKQESPYGGINNKEWSERYGIPLVSTQEELIEQCDGIMVLAPSHPETHEELSRLALKSGKPVYVDKTFAPDLRTAKRMFQLAEDYHTPCCSSSALAFVSDYEKIDKKRIQTLSGKGGGDFEVYTIHQFEPIIAMMDECPHQITFTGNIQHPSFAMKFSGDRIARTEQFAGQNFAMLVGYCDGSDEEISVTDDLFRNFIYRVIDFFQNGKLVAEKEQTLSVIATLDAAKRAMNAPFTWVVVER